MFLEKIIEEILHDHHTSISIGGRTICNLGFADIDLMGCRNGEHQDLIYELVDTARAYRMEVSTQKKSKIMTTARTT